jgi:hypothetical protein
VPYVDLWLSAFALTLAVELAVAVPLLAGAEPSRVRRAGLVFFANLSSHPIVWFVLPQLGLAHPATVMASEAWAVAIELVFYVLVVRVPWPRALAVSALANGASFSAGLLVHAATAWT